MKLRIYKIWIGSRTIDGVSLENHEEIVKELKTLIVGYKRQRELYHNRIKKETLEDVIQIIEELIEKIKGFCRRHHTEEGEEWKGCCSVCETYIIWIDAKLKPLKEDK